MVDDGAVKIALVVAYDGTDFRGFARQPGHRTVQGVLDERLSALVRAPVVTLGAGRTDRGVHAWGQVLSFDVPEGTSVSRLVGLLQRWAVADIAVRGGAVVADDFSARFSAVRRVYEYRFYRSAFADPFLDRFALHAPWPLDVRVMRAGARALLGEHDFSAFCRKGQSQPIRNVRKISLRAAGTSLTFRIEADSFCQQMVRAVTGMLIDIGRGRRAPGDMATVMAAGHRAHGAAVAPARGLHLVEVRYPRRALDLSRLVGQAAQPTKPPASKIARSQ